MAGKAIDKLRVAPELVRSVRSQEPRAALRASARQARASLEPTSRPAFDQLTRRADQVLVLAVGEAFRSAFLIAAALSLVAAGLLSMRLRRPWVLLAAVGACVAAVGVQYVFYDHRVPEPVHLADPCEPRHAQSDPGTEGAIEKGALAALDRTACHLGASREELVLALASDTEAHRFKKAHGEDPRSLSVLLGGLVGG